MAERLRLPFEILSDAKLAFANALALPAFKTRVVASLERHPL
jgi:hypothetical protein